MDEKIKSCPTHAFQYSIILTCFNEEKSIDEFIKRLVHTIHKINISAEIVIVNDGSKDKTWQILNLLFERYAEIGTVINLFRNSGQGPAITAGVANARGVDFIFMDSDLQLDPEDLELVYNEYINKNDAVVGVRAKRIDSIFRKGVSKLANLVLRKVSKSNHPDLGCNLKIISGKLIRSFNYSDKKCFDSVEVLSKAGSLGVVNINHHARKYGKSGWKALSLFKYFIDKLLQLNDQLFQYLGILMLLLSLLVIMRLAVSFYYDFSIFTNINNGTIFNLITFGFLATFGFLILLGEYVIRIYKFIHGNPIYVIKEQLKR